MVAKLPNHVTFAHGVLQRIIVPKSTEAGMSVTSALPHQLYLPSRMKITVCIRRHQHRSGRRSSTQEARAEERAIHHVESTNRRKNANGITLSGISRSKATSTKGHKSIHAAYNNAVELICGNGGRTEEVKRDADVVESVARLVESDETSNCLNNSTEEAAAPEGVACHARELAQEASASNKSIYCVGVGTEEAAEAANVKEDAARIAR